MIASNVQERAFLLRGFWREQNLKLTSNQQYFPSWESLDRLLSEIERKMKNELAAKGNWTPVCGVQSRMLITTLQRYRSWCIAVWTFNIKWRFNLQTIDKWIYVFPLDLDHLEPAPSKPGAAKRARLSPGPATPPGNEVYILGHILSWSINGSKSIHHS